MTNELLRALVDLRDKQIQKGRIQFGNRVSALERGADNGHMGQLVIAEKWAARFAELEKELDRDIANEVAGFAIYEHLSAVKGIGPMMAAKLIAMIDITVPQTVSALWRYAGQGLSDYWVDDNGKVVAPVKGQVWDGKKKEWVIKVIKNEDGWLEDWRIEKRIDKKTTGYKCPYNDRLKTVCYQIASSFLKSRSPYRDVYDAAKSKYEINRPNWTKAHIHQAAMRKMVKMFLSHLWSTWRTLEGLPVRRPYVHDYEGHTSLTTPQDFGWPELATSSEYTLSG